MANHRNRFPARRRFLKQSTALTAATVVALPRLASARTEPITPAGDENKRDGNHRLRSPTQRARRGHKT